MRDMQESLADLLKEDPIKQNRVSTHIELPVLKTNGFLQKEITDSRGSLNIIIDLKIISNGTEITLLKHKFTTKLKQLTESQELFEKKDSLLKS